MRPPLAFIFWPVFFVAQLLSLALLSWHIAAQVHFAYPLGYQLLGLQQHIAEFAPLNRHKVQFEYTSPEEHWRLFGEISDAVQHSGRGLQNINYLLRDGQSTALMHDAEIIHLQDVANLIDRFYGVGIAAMGIWLFLSVVAIWQKWQPPSNNKILTGFLAGIGLSSLGVLAIGSTRVFYWLHEQVFPDGHQWFFYYQDSLMTTLMKAPDIFAFISIFLLVILVFAWCLVVLLFKQAINHRLKSG